MIKSIAHTNFMPPDTAWPCTALPMDIPCTALAHCADGALLAVLLLDANEVLNKIPKDALHAACVALKEQSQWAYLVIIGDLTATKDLKTKADGQTRGFHWHATQGALLSVQELGVAVLHIDSEQDFGPLLERLGKRDRTTKRALAQRSIEPMTPGEDLLLSLPHVGERTALAILAECGTPIWGLIALTSYDAKIPGVGEKTVTACREALGLRPDENICLISPGDVIVPVSAQEVAA